MLYITRNTAWEKYGMQPVHRIYMQHRTLNQHDTEKALYNMSYLNMRENIRFN